MTRRRRPSDHQVSYAARDPRFLAAMAASTDPSWRLNAACREVDPDLFFPTPGQSKGPALAVCGLCDVAPQCLASTLRRRGGDDEGIVGGTTPTEREAMDYAMSRHQAAAAPPRPR